jgi:hypothetical protein
MKYRIKIANYCEFWLYTSELEQLGEAIHRHIAHGYRDGSTSWHGVQITECADGKPIGPSQYHVYAGEKTLTSEVPFKVVVWRDGKDSPLSAGELSAILNGEARKDATKGEL